MKRFVVYTALGAIIWLAVVVDFVLLIVTGTHFLSDINLNDGVTISERVSLALGAVAVVFGTITVATMAITDYRRIRRQRQAHAFKG